MNQREGVFQAVSEVLGGDISGKVELNAAQKEDVYAVLFTNFKAGLIDYKGGVPDDAKLKKYIPGLVNNWLRKDPMLNGGTKYVTQKPGSRVGSSDESLKAMRALLSITTDPEHRKEIEEAIAARTASLKPKTEVNVAALPPSLRKYVSTIPLEAEKDAPRDVAVVM